MKLDEIQGSKSFRRLNAALFNRLAHSPAAPVDSGPPQSTEPGRRGESPDCRLDRPAPRVAYRVTLIQCRRKCLDAHDSLAFSVKPLVDQITAFLGFPNDADSRLHWEYGQQETRGAEGVLVKIETITK